MTEAEWLASDDPQAMLITVQGNGAHWNQYTTKPTSDRKLRLFACACARLVWAGAVCARCGGRGQIQVYAHKLKAGETRLRVCSNCRNTGRVWHLLTDPRSRRAVEVAERYADGEAMEEEREAASADAYQVAMAGSFEAELAWRCAERSVKALTENAGLPRWFSVSTALSTTQADLLRCIAGNPWRPVGCLRFRDGCRCPECWPLRRAINPAVIAMARTIYADRDWAALGPLADALEEAGCTEEALLRHLRGEEVYIPCPSSGYYHRKAKHPPRHTCANCGGTGWRPLRGSHVRGCWALDLILGKE